VACFDVYLVSTGMEHYAWLRESSMHEKAQLKFILGDI
jgi:hypothetical protein